MLLQEMRWLLYHKCILCNGVMAHNPRTKYLSARIICFNCQRILTKQRKGQNLMFHERLIV